MCLSQKNRRSFFKIMQHVLSLVFYMIYNSIRRRLCRTIIKERKYPIMKKIFAVLLCLVIVLCASALGEVSTITYESRGVQVPATVVTPDGVESYPIVVLCHGHGGNREENVGFAAIADALAAQGVASIRMDFPGCGESTESFQNNILSNMEADVVAAIEYAKANLAVEKVGLFGYSMGGRIVLELVAGGTEADAIVLLAPANSTSDLKNLFGAEEGYEALRATANAEGFATFTTIYGQTQELSTAWFADLDVHADAAAEAAEVYANPALVIWGSDDEAVNPSVSEAVATALNASTLEATGEGHGYGFYSEDDAVRNLVAGGTADFFAANLK